MNISTSGIQDANLIVISISGGAASTAIILTRSSATKFYGGGGELTSTASQSIAGQLTHAGNTVTNITVATSAATNRTIRDIYKIY